MPDKDPAQFFDRTHAAEYDQRFVKLASFREGLHLLAGVALGGMPASAHVLCVGAGTGAEVLYLARKLPGARFTAVDPSAPMLDVARAKAAEAGIAHRCTFHAGMLDSLPAGEPFDAATAILVSQFVLDRAARVAFFREIARRLRPGAPLVSADLAADLDSPEGRRALDLWLRLMREEVGFTEEQVANLRAAYARDVAVRPVSEVAALLAEGGFDDPSVFHQAGLIHAWHATRRAKGD